MPKVVQLLKAGPFPGFPHFALMFAADGRPILVAEDDRDAQFILTRLLMRAGVRSRVEIVEDGRQAIDRLKQTSVGDAGAPALVLVDLNMPKISGVEVIEWMQMHGWLERIPVAVISTSIVQSDVDRAYTAGAAAYVEKYPDVEQLTELLDALQTWPSGEEIRQMRFVRQPSVRVT